MASHIRRRLERLERAARAAEPLRPDVRVLLLQPGQRRDDAVREELSRAPLGRPAIILTIGNGRTA